MDRQEATEAVKERLTEYVESITDHSRKGNKKAYVFAHTLYIIRNKPLHLRKT